MAHYHNMPRRPARRQPEPDYYYLPAPRFDWTPLAALLILLAFAVACFWYIMGAPVPSALPQPPAALPTAAQTYVQNIGAQAPHSPRSVPTAAPVEAQQAQPQPTVGICAPPLCRDGDGGGGQAQGWAQDAAPAVEAPPAAMPTIQPAQAEVIGARQSNGCAEGQVFYPRSGCHTPGSGGAMPGPVGAK